MEIKQYLVNKFLETASIELIKQTIMDDKSLSPPSLSIPLLQ